MKQVLTILVSALLACNVAQAMQQNVTLPIVGKVTPFLQKEHEEKRAAEAVQKSLWNMAAEEVGGQLQMTKEKAQELLFGAISKAHSDDVAKALAAGADSNAILPKSKLRLPPLMYALVGELNRHLGSEQLDYAPVVRLLLEAGADYNWKGLGDMTWIENVRGSTASQCKKGFEEFQRNKAAQEAAAKK